MVQSSAARRFWPLLAKFVLGATVLLWFFASMFNGLNGQMILAALSALTFNAVSSGLTARESPQFALLGATVFASPALLLAALGLGDLMFHGQPGPMLFWLGTGIVTTAAGLGGAWFVERRHGQRQRG